MILLCFTETDDYNNTMSAITIPAGVTSIDANPIKLVDDTIVEYNEVFNISLSYPDYVNDGDYSEVTVTIMDNDCKCIGHIMGPSIIIIR